MSSSLCIRFALLGILGLGTGCAGFDSATTAGGLEKSATLQANSSSFTLGEASQIHEQIVSYYRYFLGREPDQPGYTYWINEFYSDRLTTEQIRLSIQFSDEGLIRSYYLRHLQREPDAGGLAYWLSDRKRGQSLLQIRDNIRRAGECKYDCLR